MDSDILEYRVCINGIHIWEILQSTVTSLNLEYSKVDQSLKTGY